MRKAVEQAGADALIVHARKAWLKGLSPKENREVPPLDYARVYRLKAAHPHLTIVLNGGIAGLDAGAAHLPHVDGVMMGRAAYQEPWRLLAVDPLLFGEAAPFRSPKAGRRGARSLYRARTREGHAAARHHPPSARPVPRRAGRARFPPASRRRCGFAASRRRIPRRGARAGRGRGPGQGPRIGAHRRLTSRCPSSVTPRIKMLLGVPFSELLWLALAIVVGGVITGILAGLFGIGGGAIIVPVLYEVFRVLDVPEEVRMQLCIGTSLAIIVPTTIRSYLTHRAKGLVVPGVVRLWAVPAVIGVACGSVIAAFAPAPVFKIAFVVFAAFIATKFLFAGDRWNLGTDLPGRGPMTVYGFIIGLVASLMGVSGGSISNIVLTLYGQTMQQAVATSAGLGVPITIVGTIGYVLAGWLHDRALLPPLSIGFVSLIGFVMMAPVSSFTATYGVRLAHRLSRRNARNRASESFLLAGFSALSDQLCDTAPLLTDSRAAPGGRRVLPSFAAG